MKYLFCDLHTHSNNSDGSFTPSEIISMAKEKEIAVALTDHNTTKGLDEFLDSAEKMGVTAVAGIELSTVYGGKEVHLIGMFVDRERFPEIENLVSEFHVLKDKSNIDLINKLCENGYILNYDEIKKKNVNGNVNRAHIATSLYEKGYVSSVQEAFKTILSEKNGFYTPPKRLDLFEAIVFLRKIKAVPVLAHPFLQFDEASLREILPKAIECGLLAMETVHSKYTDEDFVTAEKVAKDFGLLKSGGSDFHGEAKPDIELGVGKGNMSVPMDFYYGLLKAKNELL